MNKETIQQPGPPILNLIYDKPLEQLILPFSNTNLKKIHTISNLHSNFFQNLIFYTHNNFEISALGDHFDIEEAKRLREDIVSLDPQHIEPLFLQSMAVYQVSQSMGIDFIDFSVFRIQPDHTIQFPLGLEEKNKFPLKELLEIFTRNKHFKNLNEKNYREVFDQLRNNTTFDENQAYIYRYDEFASTILNTYPISGTESNARIKIKINTRNHTQKKIVNIHFFNNHFSEDIFFTNIGNPWDNLPDSIDRLISMPGEPIYAGEDFVSIIDRFNLFLKKSSFTSLVLMIDCLRTNEDAEFINYLLEALEINNILLICFDTICDVIDFDLELNEKPGNLLRKYLRFDEIHKKKTFKPEQVQLLKIFHTLPMPVCREHLPLLFSPGQCTVIEDLIQRNLLKINHGKVILNKNLSLLSLSISPAEEKRILEPFLNAEVIDSLSVKIKYFLVTRQYDRLKVVLQDFHQEREAFTEAEFSLIKTILLENANCLEQNKDIQLMDLLAQLLVEETEIDTARKLIFDHDYTSMSAILKLQLAHIYKWEKHYQKMDQLLKEIEKEVGSRRKRNIFLIKDLNDQYHYLKFVFFEKKSEVNKADKHLEIITKGHYRQRAAVLLSDRYIYRGDYQGAQSLLDEAIDYFSRNKYPADEIEAKSHLAKLLRARQEFTDAEKLYQNLFIKSEMKNYRLLSTYITIDLGNLYMVQDQLNLAHNWYKKGLKLFQNQNNQNGIMLARSNLVLVNKIKGNWQKAKEDLESILDYNKQKDARTSLAIDYVNAANLEYLKQDFPKAREFIQEAWPLLQKSSYWDGIIDCEWLKLKMSLWLDPRNKIDLSFFKKNRERLNHDYKILVYIIEIFLSDRSNRKIHLTIKNSNRIKSKNLRFEIISILAVRYKSRELLAELKSLSAALSKEDKNYYYFEYFYIYYGYFYPGIETDEDEKERFNEIYYFFQENQRKLSPNIIKYKHMLDHKDSQYEMFKSAELVGDYIHWKIPGDFFNSLVHELRKSAAVELVRLVIYEGKNKAPRFDFSRVVTGFNAAGAIPFDAVTNEMIMEAAALGENLNLSLEEVKNRYKSSEKAFYFYKNTKVILWKISKVLFAELLVAFSKEEYYDYDFNGRHQDLLKKFASLIHRYLQKDLKPSSKLNFIIGESPAIKLLKKTIIKVSSVDFSVLIYGESGSGKELVARAVHLLSRRAGNAFKAVNAAAIPENLLEAELFGYKKGAFTGASENKTGLIEAAHNGTLFLDEIADLPLNLQAKLLRALQENEIRRLGENNARKVNIRLISATNKNLKQLITLNQFREDLYFRLQDLTIDVPPLKKRLEDIPLLVQHFLKKYGFTVTDKNELQRIIDYFKGKTWTGNVRELESNVKRLITYYPDFDMEQDTGPVEMLDTGLMEARDNLEKQMLNRALKETNWNKQDAAAVLKITRQYFFKLMKKHGISLHTEKGNI